MSMNKFPVTPDALTAEWLSGALGFPVQDFEVEYFAEGVGILSMVTRVRLTTASNNPQSIIAKFPSPISINRLITSTYGMYAREVMFYQSMADKVPIRSPHCFYTIIDPTTDDFIMLLEDLDLLRIGDQVAGCTLPEAKLVLSALAEMQANTWQGTQFPDLISHNNPD